MNGTHRPLNNRAYSDKYGQQTSEYPHWWREAGGRLIPLESGIGTRVWLHDFTELYRDGLEPCRFYKREEPLEGFDPAQFLWRFWVVGPFGSVEERPCREMEIEEWLFYSIAEGIEPLPVFPDAGIISSEPMTEFRDGKICAYFTREITQRMRIGMFYLGVPVVEGTIGGDDTPESITPAQRVSQRPKLPPMWAFVQDTQRTFHSRFEDIPTRKRSLCP